MTRWSGWSRAEQSQPQITQMTQMGRIRNRRLNPQITQIAQMVRARNPRLNPQITQITQMTCTVGQGPQRPSVTPTPGRGWPGADQPQITWMVRTWTRRMTPQITQTTQMGRSRSRRLDPQITHMTRTVGQGPQRPSVTPTPGRGLARSEPGADCLCVAGPKSGEIDIGSKGVRLTLAKGV